MDALVRDERFFEEISLRTKSFGCAFKVWEVSRNGRFQPMEIDNQSLNLTPSGRSLPWAVAVAFRAGRDFRCPNDSDNGQEDRWTG